MYSKIKTLIEKLNLSDNCTQCLKDAKLEKIVANKEKTNYCFYITINSILDIDLYKEFEDNGILFDNI